MPQSNLIFRNFGFKMQESSDFKIFTHIGTRVVKDVVPPSRKGMPEGKTMATDPGLCRPRTISGRRPGVPSSCFGETEYFVTGVSALGP